MADSEFYKILSAMHTVVSALTLVETPGVHWQKTATDQPKDKVSLPAILIAPEGTETIDPNGGTNERDDIVYPVGVYDLSDSKQDYTNAGQNPPLLRRQVIRRAFHNKRLSGVPSVLKVVCQPKEIIYSGSFKTEHLNAGGLLFLVTNREMRT